MFRSELAVLVTAALGAVVQSSLPASESPADRLVSCVAKASGMLVFADPGVGARLRTEPSCSAIEADLPGSLAAMGVLISGPTASKQLYLYPAAYRKGNPPYPGLRVIWKEIEVRIESEGSGDREDARDLGESERARLTSWLVAAARPAPVGAPHDADGNQRAAEVPYVIGLLARVMAKGTPEEIVAIMGERNGATRLAKVVRDGQRFRLSWDSPVFNGERMTVGFVDLTGDGRDEIMVQHAYGLQGEGKGFIAFDYSGDELTLTEPCETGPWPLWDRAGSACPILGVEISFIRAPNGRALDLIVQRVVGGEKRRFTLTNGRYRAVV